MPLRKKMINSTSKIVNKRIHYTGALGRKKNISSSLVEMTNSIGLPHLLLNPGDHLNLIYAPVHQSLVSNSPVLKVTNFPGAKKVLTLSIRGSHLIDMAMHKTTFKSFQVVENLWNILIGFVEFVYFPVRSRKVTISFQLRFTQFPFRKIFHQSIVACI